MKITYDPAVDALSIIFHEGLVTTQELADGIAAEFSSDGRLAGIEILDATRYFVGAETLKQVVWKARD